MEEEHELGKVTIDKEVLAAMAGFAAKKVAGVNRLATGFVAGITQFIRRSQDAGIKVLVGEGEVGFELRIIVEYGVNIPEITHKIQKNIKEEVENVSGLKVTRVDVVVNGVCLPREERKERRDDVHKDPEVHE